MQQLQITFTDCIYCNGRGWHDATGDLCDKCCFGEPNENYILVPCPECNGNGKDLYCGTCCGEGRISVLKRKEVPLGDNTD